MRTRKLLSNVLKIAVLMIIAVVCLGRMVTGGLDTYRDFREFEYYNFGTGEDCPSVPLCNAANQIITARGQELSELSLYLTNVDPLSEGFIHICIRDGNGNLYGSRAYALSDCTDSDWNHFPVNISGLRVDASYIAEISSDDEKVCGILRNGEVNTGYFGIYSDNSGEYSGALNCGLKYNYGYLTVGAVFQIIADYMIAVMLIAILGYTLYSSEQLYASINKSAITNGIIPAACGSLLLFYTINPVSQKVIRLEEFKRSIGVGIMELNDVTKIVRNFQLCFVVVILSFVLFSLLFCYQESKIRESSPDIYEFLRGLNVLFLINLCMRGLLFYRDTDIKSFYYAGYVFVAIYICVYIYAKTNIRNRMSTRIYTQYLVAAATLGMAIAVCFSNEWRDGRFMLGVQCIMIALTMIYLWFGRIYDLGIFVAFSAWLPMIISAYSELVIILNQRGIMISAPKDYYIAILLLYITTAIVVSYLWTKKQTVFDNYKKVAYPGIIIGLSSMAVQPLIYNTYTVDFIESSNSSILISDFLNFGSIPIVEHYGGHMMTGVWEGIIYGILTGDTAGAIFSPYAGYFTMVIALLFYWLIKNVSNEDMALLTVILIPFAGMTEYYGLGLLIAIALMAYDRKQTVLNGFLIWLAFGWVTLYRLDMGFSFLWGIGLVLLCGCVLKKEAGYLKNAIVSLVITAVVALATWAGICVSRGISPIIRLKEFLMLSASNQTWAYGSLGDSGITAFPVMYLFLPVLVIILLIYVLFSEEFRLSIKRESWMLLVYLGAAYLGNFSRTIVRHSVLEMKIHILTWSALLFIALFMAARLKNSRLLMPVYIALFIGMMLFKSEGIYNEQPIIGRAAANATSILDSWSIGRFNRDNPESMTLWEQSAQTGESINRVLVDEDNNNRIMSYKYLIDSLLEENQSFVEIMDRTFLYSALGRKNPLYVSQSPIQISGEFSQEQYIAQIEAARDYCPIVLLPVDGRNFRASSYLEGTSHTYKYYKVFEYLYDNFTPVCAYDDVAVWCRNDQLETVEARASYVEGAIPITWGYDGPVADENGIAQYQSFLHNYDLLSLANAWGNLDVRNAADNEVICEGKRTGIIYSFDLDENDYVNPAYLGISLQAINDDSKATIIMGDTSSGAFVEKCRYVLDISSDVNYYMIRVSSDYYWHLGEINAMYLVSEDKVYADSARFIMGD